MHPIRGSGELLVGGLYPTAASLARGLGLICAVSTEMLKHWLTGLESGATTSEESQCQESSGTLLRVWVWKPAALALDVQRLCTISAGYVRLMHKNCASPAQLQWVGR
jgi:hypothetical protein